MAINIDHSVNSLTPTGSTTSILLNKVTITAPTNSATLSLGDGSTLATSGAFTTTITATATTNISLSGDLTVSSAANISGTNTGDQTITLSGDVSGTGTGSFVTTIANNAVTFGKFQQSAAAGLSVIGRNTNSAGNFAEISAANDGEVLRRSGTAIGFGTIGTAGITNSAVTYAKIQNVSATNRLLGRSSAGAGVIEEIACTSAGRNILATSSSGSQGQLLMSTGTSTSPKFISTNYMEPVELATGSHEVIYYGPNGSSSVYANFQPKHLPYNTSTSTSTVLNAPRTSFTTTASYLNGDDFFSLTGAGELIYELNFRGQDYIVVTGAGIPSASTTATGTSGAFTITVSSATGIVPGQYVRGTGIGVDCFVSASYVPGNTTIPLTVANSGTVSGTITFSTVISYANYYSDTGIGPITAAQFFISTYFTSNQTNTTITFTQPSWSIQIDGVTPTAGVEGTGSRILLTNQSTSYSIGSKRNGIYYLSTGGTNWVLTRTSDANTSALLKRSQIIYVNNGNNGTGLVFESQGIPLIGALNSDRIVYTDSISSRNINSNSSYWDYLRGKGIEVSGSLSAPTITSDLPTINSPTINNGYLYNTSLYQGVRIESGNISSYGDLGGINLYVSSQQNASIDLALSFLSGSTSTDSCVNYFGIKNAITGSAPKLEAVGTDTNINIELLPKGTGLVVTGGDLSVGGGDIITTATTGTVFNTTATTINAFNATTTLSLGYSGTATNTSNIITGATASGSTKTINLGTGGASGSTTTITIGANTTGSRTISQSATNNLNNPTVIGSSSNLALTGPVTAFATSPTAAGTGYRDGVNEFSITGGTGTLAYCTASVGGGIIRSIVATPTKEGRGYTTSDLVTLSTPLSAITVTGASGTGTTATLTFAAQNSLATTAASGTGTTATLTFAAQTVAPYPVGSRITVSGVTPTGYNGTFVVTACTTTTVSYANTTTGAQTVAGTISIIPFVVGGQITIASVNPAGYNATNAVVTACTATSVSYANITTTAYVSGGTINQGTATSNGTFTVSSVRQAGLSIINSTYPRLRLENTSTSVSVGTELGSILFGCDDTTAGGSGDKARITTVAENTSGGGTVQVWTSANALEPTLCAAFGGNNDFRLYNTAGTFYHAFTNNPTANRTISLPDANITFANAFTTSGNFSLTLTTTNTTNVTLPTTGTLATLAGTETLTNKTFASNSYSTTQSLTVANDLVFISAAAAWTLTLPTPTAGKVLTIVRTDATAFIITVSGHINGTASTSNTTWFPASTANRRVVLVSNGTSWYSTVAGTVA